MLTTTFAIVLSATLFVYWFRHSCVLILSSPQPRQYAKTVAEANGLAFLNNRNQIAQAAPARLDQIRDSLNHDYVLVTYLLNHAANFRAGDQTWEQALLKFDYVTLSWCYRMTRGISGRWSRHALAEMTTVVTHLADLVGERFALSARN